MPKASCHSTKDNIVIIEELENARNEVGALRRAVESKTAAISILRAELEACQNERDEFRVIIESNPIEILNTRSIIATKPSVCPEIVNSAILSECTLAELLSQSKEENKQLRIEMIDFRCRLHDALSDLKVMREEKYLKSDKHHSRLSARTNSHLAQQERETFLNHLEKVSSKCQALEGDLRCILEEREELLKEQDETKHKLYRLNHIVNVLMTPPNVNQEDDRPIIDIDAIVMENRYLQQRINQLREEKQLAINSASKYKSVIEKCQENHGGAKFGSSENLIFSLQQVSEFLKQCEGEVGECLEADLKSVCIALVDSLKQKSRVAKSQKAANKMLAARVDELERRLCPPERRNDKSVEDITFASNRLVDGYIPPVGHQVTRAVDDNILELLKHHTNKGLSRNISFKEEELNETSEKTVEESDSEVFGEETQITSSSFNNNAMPLSSESDLEEIVSVESFDSYISNLKEKRILRGHHIVGDKGDNEKPEANNSEAKVDDFESIVK